MASRPRRSAATKANEVISAHARLADSPERGERGTMSSRRSGRVSRDAPTSPGTVKVANPTRHSTRAGRAFTGGEIVEGKRNRGGRKSYVVDSSPEEDEEEEDEEDEIEVEEEEDDDDDELDEDAEGEEMDVDAEGEDADGDIDMDMAPPAPTIKVSKPSRSKPAPRASAAKIVPDDDDDDELSDPDSDVEQTMGMDETIADEDAEGEEIEVAGEEMDDDDEEEEEEAEADSDEGSQDEEVDLTKLTKRQRARFEDEPQQYMKLSDEVQAKKVFTAEELSMRRQEMARRRRNLSEKRNEEVKMETINKLLKKQAPKINRKAAAGGNGSAEDAQKADPIFVRWVSNKNGVRIAVPDEMMQSPVGAVFGGRSGLSGKMVEEVA